MTHRIAAVDLGASSGRVMVAEVAPGQVRLHEAHRFGNGPVRLGHTLHWDVLALYRGALDGLRAGIAEHGGLDSVGIDSWAVDYGLLDATGALLGNPVHYRDERTHGVAARVADAVPPAAQYAVNGLQELPFNTVFQLVAAAGTPVLGLAERLLLIPDLLAYWLTGVASSEVTNVSTTGLLDVTTRDWARGLMADLHIDAGLLTPLVHPGERIGMTTAAVTAAIGAPGPVPVTAVGSHDTASAVVGVPASGSRFAYVSCGTWSLVGVELTEPVLTEDSRAANFTNEGGVDGTVRYLRNVMGLWLLQESVRTWEAAGETVDLTALLAAAARVPARQFLVDPDDARFLPPGDMPARIATLCRERGSAVPATPPETTRAVLDSLALAYRRTVRQAVRLSGQDVNVVHVVGGGSRNALLCQLTADACGLPVAAGPVEAAALGNVLVQARALGVVEGGLDEIRALVRDTQQVTWYQPNPTEARAWDAVDAQQVAAPAGR